MKKNGNSFVFVVKQVIIAAAVVVALVIALVVFLRKYTQHGIEVITPDVTQLYLEEARIVAEAEGLRLMVIDSTYSQKVPLGTIVEQSPLPGSKVKHGRTIHVIENAKMRRPVVVPELRDVSLRQAQATLAALGLQVDSITYEPSMYRDIVLDVRTDTVALQAGDRISEGTQVTLVVGQGKGTEEVVVPTLIGKSLEEARAWLFSHSLTLGTVTYDIEPTEETMDTYIVYSQTPESGTVVVEGTNINIKLSTDIEKTITSDNEESEEEFF
jgi:beta-lactam-binding protein with PASTA domain